MAVLIYSPYNFTEEAFSHRSYLLNFTTANLQEIIQTGNWSQRLRYLLVQTFRVDIDDTYYCDITSGNSSNTSFVDTTLINSDTMPRVGGNVTYISLPDDYVYDYVYDYVVTRERNLVDPCDVRGIYISKNFSRLRIGKNRTNCGKKIEYILLGNCSSLLVNGTVYNICKDCLNICPGVSFLSIVMILFGAIILSIWLYILIKYRQ